MKINKIKLGQLSKNAMGDNQMKNLKGGEYYCDWGPENKSSNIEKERCSCYCSTGDYYDTSTGLSAIGDWIKVNW